MDNLGKDFLDFLATDALKEARNELYNFLEAGDDEVNVYYLIPLFNLKSIIADGGIKCRAMMDRDVTDLSGQEVQKRRDKSLKLGQKVSSFVEIDKRIHECVSFLWNPLNDTSSAFQRNALLLAADKHNDTYGIACILEMRLSAFFESDRVYWSISEQNLASSDFSSYSKRIYKNFDWPTIFSVPNAGRESNKFRSAEFIAFYGNPSLESSDLIPTRFIKMILVPAQYETKVKEVVPSVQGRVYPLTNSKVFYPKEELLKAEKHLIETIDYLQKLALPMPLSTEKFCDLVNTFSNFKERLGCSLTDELFSSKTIAHSFHGISHITRIRKKSKGCDVNYFRLDIFKNHPKLKEYLTWSAYWLASITHYTKWSENTFVDLKKEIVRSLKALLRNDILDQDKRQMVNKMLRRLSVD